VVQQKKGKIDETRIDPWRLHNFRPENVPCVNNPNERTGRTLSHHRTVSDHTQCHMAHLFRSGGRAVGATDHEVHAETKRR
jgi:hypothetical protein